MRSLKRINYKAGAERAASPLDLSPSARVHVPPPLRESTIGLDDIIVSTGLMCLSPADSGIPLVCIPAGNGHSDRCRLLASVVDNPLYGVMPTLDSANEGLYADVPNVWIGDSESTMGSPDSGYSAFGSNMTGYRDGALVNDTYMETYPDVLDNDTPDANAVSSADVSI